MPEAPEGAGPADVLCIFVDRLRLHLAGHQEIMSTLAARGHRVLFSRKHRACGRCSFETCPACAAVFATGRRAGGIPRRRPNLFRVLAARPARSVFAPDTGSTGSCSCGPIRRWMRATGVHAADVWTFLPTPLAHELVTHLDPTLTIYYCIDDFVSSSPKRGPASSTARSRCSARADLVFRHPEALRRRATAPRSRAPVFHSA